MPFSRTGRRDLQLIDTTTGRRGPGQGSRQIYAIRWWQARDMKNFHLPLPDDTYEHLRAAAKSSKVPATVIAREAIDFWLRQRLQKAPHDSIAAHAAKMAGTDWTWTPSWRR